MSGRSLVSLPSTYFRVLAAMHDAQTQGGAPRATSRRETYPLPVARYYILSRSRACVAAEMQRGAVAALPAAVPSPCCLCEGLVTDRRPPVRGKCMPKHTERLPDLSSSPDAHLGS